MHYTDSSDRSHESGVFTSNLILLFEAVTVGGLHQVDVLQQVGHPYGRMELSGLIGRLGALAVVARDVQQSAVLGRRRVVLV